MVSLLVKCNNIYLIADRTVAYHRSILMPTRTRYLSARTRRTFFIRCSYTDVNMDLVELLMKQDQMSMAASIESRVPFLDHLLVEFAGTIPPHLRLQGRAGKQLVKKATEKFLPHNIVHRQKMGFPVPFGSWLKEDSAGMVSEILLDKRTMDRGYFNVSYIEKLLKSHQSGQRDYQNQIWLLLNFELWHLVFIDDGARC